jgi:hypothetical protein
VTGATPAWTSCRARSSIAERWRVAYGLS